MFDRNKTCCFTGHRPEKMPNGGNETDSTILQLKKNLHSAIEQEICRGHSCFICGMSRGFDLWAAEEVLTLRQGNPAVKLVCAVPFEKQPSRWTADWQMRYHTVLTSADYVFCLARSFSPDCYHTRNRFMVEHSTVLICCFDGTPGGTAYTVRYAEKQGLSITNLAQRQLSLF